MQSTERETGSHTKSLLLTGFGPFPGVRENASARLVEALALQARAEFLRAGKRVEVHAAILPTEWERAPERLSTLIAKHKPDVSLHFGVASGAKGFRIETRAANACRLDEDAAGLLPAAEWLHQNGAAFREVTIPVEAIVARLTEMGLPVATSDDAGAYLCNAVLYHALQTRREPRAGFIHIPATLDGPPLTFNDAVRGAMEIVRACLTSSPPLDGEGLGVG